MKLFQIAGQECVTAQMLKRWCYTLLQSVTRLYFLLLIEKCVNYLKVLQYKGTS